MTPTLDSEKEVRVLASFMHSEYEQAADSNGWDTQEGTSVPFEDLPEENRRTMLSVAESVLWYFETDDLPENSVRRALSAVEREASKHGRDYGAGMQLARSILEQELSTVRVPETPDDLVTCHACKSKVAVEHVEQNPDDYPECPVCSGNMLPPVADGGTVA